LRSAQRRMTAGLQVLILQHPPEPILEELRRAGHNPCWSRVETEPDFVRALDGEWDVILADFEWPQFSALRALALLHERARDIPFILVSAAIDQEGLVTVMRAGAHDFVATDGLPRLGPIIEREIREARERQQRRRQDDEARAGDRRGAMLLEMLHELVFLVNRDGVIEYVNTAAARQAGVPPQALIGLKLVELLPRENALRYLQSVRRVLESGRALYVEAVSLFGKKPIWLGSWIVPVTEPEGRAELALIVSRDITEARRVAHSHELLAMAVEQTGEAIMITGLDGAIQYVNPAFEEASGYTSAEVVGRNPRILKSGRHGDEFYRQMWAALTSGQVWQGHMVNKRKDGTLHEEDLTISPVRDASGRIRNYVAAKRDVTEEIALRRQSYQAEKMESVGRLAGGIAHDFNNLLTIINGSAELALEDLKDDHPLREELTQIRRAGDHAASLTRQLLAFSRRQVRQRRVLSLFAVVADTERMLLRLIGEDVDLMIRSRANADSVRADLGQLEQVLVNLVVNARDAMPQGGRLVIEVSNVELDNLFGHVHGHIVRPGPYVMLSVTDSGMGMDESTRLRIFEPFFTTKGHGQGTGLGLATVYGIVKQNGGYVQVHSEVGRGTTFSVCLPQVPGPPDPPPASPAAGMRGTETILLVEDQEDLRHLASKVLTRAGYTVLTAASGVEAMSLLTNHPGPLPLVITDIVMPGISGTLLGIECQKARPGTRVLYMSGYTSDVIVRHGVDLGMPFLHKPFTASELTCKVRDALDSTGFTGPEQ
jgi:two-component system, cell cycle sensor histidine kinase and response regulator CckA